MARSGGSILLSWGAVHGADGYNIHRDHDVRAHSPDEMRSAAT